ncbi:Lrp/AsnC family transcriptional regulator [Telmatospirillum sp. J64-1]|uniref:Lrp/AsnC family transcriptional regulator n=1 Tax=Telmatospirillum sp. J64-1 TaxID=2502183 RepID=UPI00115DDDAA|nr:Lrp/AsnC family transcriptional regulator [Telmatospirillum sp. J64-1]
MQDKLPEKVFQATMDLAADMGWRRLSLADIAERADMSLLELSRRVRNKAGILSAFTAHIDEKVLEGGSATDISARDRLFDVMMRRFDALAPYKPGLRVIAQEAGGDPVTVLCGFQRICRSAALMLEAARISSDGLSGLAKVNGLVAVHVYTFRTWLHDDSEDMSRTMAALDKALRRCESLAASFGSRRGRRPPEEDVVAPAPEPPPEGAGAAP